MKISIQSLSCYGRTLLVMGLGSLLLVGCGNQEKSPSEQTENSVWASPSATSAFESDPQKGEVLDAQIAVLKARIQTLQGEIIEHGKLSQQFLGLVEMEIYQNAFDRLESDGRNFIPRTSAHDLADETSRNLDRLLAERSAVSFRLKMLQAERAALR
ncbi:MAG TPA: hypothetical protein VGH19_18485 [Verrucomicrobiae bacterium]